MYETFFQMSHTPFSRSIPVSEMYSDPEVQEMHDRLVYTAKNQLFAVLVADAGMGKTAMLRRFRSSLADSEYTVLYLADSKLTPRHFYNGLLEQMGCETKFYRGDARRLLHQQIEIMRGLGNRRLVVIVDESHLLSKEMLEEIRFLLNYHMDSENPLALILAGQTELWDRLKLQAFRAVQHRIDVKCFMPAYDLARTKAYIERQIAWSGHEGPIFTDDAIRLVQDFSGGVPRLINRACSQSLIFAYQTRRNLVDDRMMKQVIDSEV